MRLKELRKKENKTQEEIAKFLNMSQVSYGRYELETSEPTIETLCKLADYYHVSLDYLVGREYESNVDYINDSEKALLAMFRELNQENQVKANGQVADILINQKKWFKCLTKLFCCDKILLFMKRKTTFHQTNERFCLGWYKKFLTIVKMVLYGEWTSFISHSLLF